MLQFSSVSRTECGTMTQERSCKAGTGLSYFDPIPQNRGSYSIMALVSKLLAGNRKGEA